MTVKWVTPAGSLGIITERIPIDLEIQAVSSLGNPLTYKIISGKLPRGIRLSENFLRGSPSEVRKFTTTRFVIRASDGIEVEDRTFTISVDGSDIPEWFTKEGFLQVGKGQAFFVLDNSKVEFQLEAADPDLNAGDTLEFYLLPRGGELPPGLTLSKTGLISGFTDPVFALDYGISRDGGFDVDPYDITPIDFKEVKSNGYDSFIYDTFSYDYNEPSRQPKRLSRIYNFAVAVSDGINVISRIFKIYVVTEEFLKADNSIVQVGTNVFTADSSSDREPIWITESNIGRFRANNYVTIFLEVYNPPTLPGSITFIILPLNTDNTPSELPPGLELDTVTGQIAGYVPYQPRITSQYKFTVAAIYYPASVVTDSISFLGDWESFSQYNINDTVRFMGSIYICIKAHLNRTPGNNEFWISSSAISEKTFTVDIFGEIDSGIEWISNEDLGTIRPNIPSNLSVTARSLLYGGKVVYTLVSGNLPAGLQFLPNGLLIGKAKQFADSDGPGLTRFFDNGSERNFNVVFDSEGTSFDRQFVFTVNATDTANFSKLEKTFFFNVVSETDKTFANLYLKAFQKKEYRLEWSSFITDVNIFTPTDLYRYGDTNFSTQTEIKMLVFAGIESVDAVNYVQAMSKNHYRKRMLFGDIKLAKGKDSVTQETLYEVVYVEMIDEYEKNGDSISKVIELPNKINSPVLVSYDAIRVDSNIPFVSDKDHQRVFPNSISNMRDRIRATGLSNRQYLPLWMRSIQDRSPVETGYVKAVVLCYANPGKGETIVSKIKASGFDFKNIDFVADRYLIDIIDGKVQDKYLAFPQRGEKLP
jgi:hypothetical protein